MDVDALLANMRAANFFATMALGLLLVAMLLDYIEWLNAKQTPPGQWCEQHAKPKHECRDEHRP